MTASNETATRHDSAAEVEGIVDTLAASRIRSVVAIVIVALIAFLPGLNTTGPLDRDEPWFALGTKQIVETGDYADIALPDGPWFAKPIGMYWLQAAAVAVAGQGPTSPIWVYRLPSLLGAVAAALLTWWMALAFGRPRAALLAGVLLAATPLLVAEAHLAKADAVFLAALVLAEGALARLWLGKSPGPEYRLAFLFWTGLALAVLIKGLMAVLVIGLTVGALAAFGRSVAWLRRLAPIPGAIWLVVLVAPWFVTAWLAGAGSSLATMLPERIAAQEVYNAPPGSYAVLFYPLFGPAGVFVALAIPGVIDRIRRPAFLFAIASVVPFWIVMELSPWKLPYYILPAYPTLALVGAIAIDEGRARITGWVSAYFSLNLAVWPAVVGFGAVIAFFLAERKLPIAAIPFFILAIGVGVYSFRWFYREISVVGAAALSVLSALLVYIGLFGVVIPGLSSLQISAKLVAAGKAAVTCDKPEMAATGFLEPSLVFFAGNGIRLTPPGEAAEFLAQGGCRVAFVEARRQSIFNQRAEDIGLDLVVKGEVRGGDIGNWKSMTMRVFAVEGQP